MKPIVWFCSHEPADYVREPYQPRCGEEYLGACPSAMRRRKEMFSFIAQFL